MDKPHANTVQDGRNNDNGKRYHWSRIVGGARYFADTILVFFLSHLCPVEGPVVSVTMIFDCIALAVSHLANYRGLRLDLYANLKPVRDPPRHRRPRDFRPI